MNRIIDISLRMLNGVIEFDETSGLLVTDHWCERNRRDSDDPQEDQRNRQTQWISSFSERMVNSLFHILYSRTGVPSSQYKWLPLSKRCQ